MRKFCNYLGLLLVVAFIVLSLTFSTQAASPTKDATSAKLPKIVTITCNELGSTDYLKAMGIRVAVEKRSPILLRIEGLASIKAMVETLRTGESEFTIQSGATAYRITHGEEDFKDWGPTPLRRVWNGKPLTYFMCARGDAGYMTIAELRGKRIPQCAGQWGWSNNVQALLAFGNLTLKDVQVVNVSSIAIGMKGVVEGNLDATCSGPWAGAIQELAASRYGIKWFDMPKEDTAGWERVRKFVPWAGPMADNAAGLKPNQTIIGFGYEGGVWAYEKTPEDVVYAFCNAMKDSYEDMKKITPDLDGFTFERAASLEGLMMTPFHSGMVKLLKEKGLWTAEHEKFQQEALRLEKEATVKK